MVSLNPHNTIAISQYDSHIEWIPYQGSRQISKSDFLYLTGEYELAEEVAAEYKRVKTWNTIGNVLCWGGIGVSAIGLIWMLCSFDNDDNFMRSSIMTYVSLGVACVGLPFLYIKPKDDIPVSFAINLANIYNSDLLDALR